MPLRKSYATIISGRRAAGAGKEKAENGEEEADGRARTKATEERKMSEFFRAVYELTALVPAGKVTTYGDIARAAGYPRRAREVGWALHVNPDPERIPCFRVVNREGRLAPAFAFGGEDIQRLLLERDGVAVEERKDGLYVKDFPLVRFGF